MFYLVTVHIDRDIADDWQDWMRRVHIPDVVDTGCFLRAWMCRQPEDDTDGRLAFRMVYLAESREEFQRYQNDFAAALQADHTERYEGRFKASRSLCDVLDNWP